MNTGDEMEKNKKIYLGIVLRSREAWQALTTTQKSPAVSFKLMKYHRDVLDTLFRVIEDQRNDYIVQCADTTAGPAVIDPKTNPEGYKLFVDLFSDYLQVETDLVQIDMTLEQLIDDLSRFEGNSVNEQTLMMIDPFFKGA